MSEDRTNEEEEENKNEFFDDGDDFGLPDLDYDELDEEAEDTPLEEEVQLDVESETEDSTPDFDTTSDFDATSDLDTTSDLDSASDLDTTSDFETDDAPAYDEESISTDDLTAEDFEISDEELEGIEENVEGFTSDDLDFGGDSYGDFEPDPEAAAFAAESSEADSFGEHSDELSTGSEYRYADEKSRSSFTKIVIIGTVVILGLASGFWWYAGRGDRAREAQKKTAPAKTADPKPQPVAAKDTAQAKQETPPPRTTPPPQPQAQRPQQQQPRARPVASSPGEIRTISERTGNSFIIVGSFVDEDLANDFAQKLATAGESPTVISPPGNQLFYRVAIASFNSYDEAAQALNDFRPNFGEDAWALRY